jgi:serine/threonine-protein kinase
LNLSTDFIGTLERRFYDFSSTSTSRQPSDRIAVIAIDDQSVANIGRWPWPRDVHAKLIDQLSVAKAKTVVYTAFFLEPQVDAGLVYIRKMKALLAGAPDQGGANEQMGRLIGEAEAALDTDAILAASIKNAGNVLIPSVYSLGEQQGRPDNPLPSYSAQSAIDETSGFSVSAVRGQQPIAIIGEAAAGIGHLNQFPDVELLRKGDSFHGAARSPQEPQFGVIRHSIEFWRVCSNWKITGSNG